MTSNLDARLAPLAERYSLPPKAVGKLRLLLRLLTEDRRAPTGVRDPSKVLNDHLADSLVALELEQVRAAAQVADLGSGAGLPGLPLAIALPRASFALVEAAARKAAFIERAARECAIANVEVVAARAESWLAGADRFELVTARAVAALEVVVEYAAPLLRVGGSLVAWRGRRDANAEAAAARAAEALGLEVVETRAVSPYQEARHRHLHLMLKVKETPEGFPRRPGIALKRPLGR